MALPQRKAIRLPEYDYSTPGAYFVTICTHDRQCILSDIIVGADAPGGPRGENPRPHKIPGEIVRRYAFAGDCSLFDLFPPGGRGRPPLR